MAAFFAQNAGNLVIGALVLAAVALAILRVRKSGKADGCGCGCAGCTQRPSSCASRTAAGKPPGGR